jgi:CheY-like chemotaxis protein
MIKPASSFLLKGKLYRKKPTRKVLVVDDDPGMIRILEKRLRMDGYEVLGALSGKSCLQRAKSELPDIVLLDLMIPDLSGIEVARRLRENPTTKGIPIIFMTVTMGVENDKGNEEINIDGNLYRIFAKPLHDRKLLSTMRKTINRRIYNQ